MSPCRALSEALSSQLSACVVRARGRRALSMCDSPVPDTLITLHVTRWHTHTHTHTQRKQGIVRGHERVRQTSTTRKRSGRKELVDSERQKWEREREVDLPLPVSLLRDSLFPCLLSLRLLFSHHMSPSLLFAFLCFFLFMFMMLVSTLDYEL